MKKFTNESMFEIMSYLHKEFICKNEIRIEVLNPILKSDLYAGEKLIINNQEFIYRSYKSWSDLAEILFCRMLIESINLNTVVIFLQKLNKIDSFHKDIND